MPTVFEVLGQTMLFSGGGGQLNPLAPGDAIPAPEPSPTVSRDHAIRLKNPVWAWDHTPATPSKITNLRSKVLGMGMNYSHAMIVCQEISVDEVGITDKDGNDFKLPLEQSFVMHKWNIKQGIIPSKTFPLWPLEAELDQSIMVVFGYQIVDGNTKPFTRDQATLLRDRSMPPLGQEAGPDPVTVGEVKNIVVSPLRILVCLGLHAAKSATISNRVECLEPTAFTPMCS